MSNKTLLVIFFGVLSLSICSAAFAFDDIEKVYRKQCGVCHGDEGDGRGRAGANLTPPASSFTSPALKSRLTSDYIVGIIRDGKPGTAMAAYGKRFDKQQISALSDYILRRFVKPEAQVSARQNDGVSGKDIYIKNCSACHGDNGNTAVWAKNGLNPPPRNFTSQLAREELSFERMISSVSHGRPGTAMMPFSGRLSQIEIEAVVRYIRQEFMNVESLEKPAAKAQENTSASPSSKVAKSNSFPNALKGDQGWGRSFYMSNCFTCHGIKGDGKGPRAHFNQPRPRDFTSEETARLFDRTKLFHAIKNGKKSTVMPAWGVVLSDQEIANVAEFVYQSFVMDGRTQKKN